MKTVSEILGRLLFNAGFYKCDDGNYMVEDCLVLKAEMNDDIDTAKQDLRTLFTACMPARLRNEYDEYDEGWSDGYNQARNDMLAKVEEVFGERRIN